MKLISSRYTNFYQEIVVEEKFLWFIKWRTTYRSYDGLSTIFRYVHPNQFYNIGYLEQLRIQPFFKIVIENENTGNN